MSKTNLCNDDTIIESDLSIQDKDNETTQLLDEQIQQSVKRIKKFPLHPTQGKCARKCGAPNTRSSSSRANKCNDPPLSQSTIDAIEFNELQEDLSSAIVCIKDLLSKFEGIHNSIISMNTRFAHLESRLQKAEDSNSAALTRIDLLEAKIQMLEKSWPVLSNDASSAATSSPTGHESYSDIVQNPAMIKIKTDVETLQQLKLESDLLLSGKAVTDLIVSRKLQQHNDRIKTAAMELLGNISDLNTQHLTIRKCFLTNSDKPQIRIKFSTPEERSEVFQCFFKMESKPFHLNEVLIRSRAKLFYDLRSLRKKVKEIKKEDLFKSTFTRRGEIYYVLKNDEDQVCKVASLQDIVALADKLSV